MVPSMQPTRTEAIKNFLKASTHPDLAEMYSYDMEVQVNVAQDGGTRVTKDYKGRQYQSYTDGVQTWKAMRIPYKANSEPEYSDVAMSFDLSAHVEGIGMTGWDWVNRCSRWVAYDFDAIIGHSERHLAKLTPVELQAVRDAAFKIPWVTVRKSTSGSGLHLYVMLDGPETKNHNEHAAMARAILGKMAALTGFDFQSAVDICGGNMWVWHRKMRGTDGLELIKQGETLYEVPPNWQDHVKVVNGTRRKALPKEIESTSQGDKFEEIAGQRPKIKFDAEHQRLIDWLEGSDSLWWWDKDHYMLVTHTYHLQEAHEELSLKGFYQTDSKGNNTNEQNCFAFPINRGAWAVRRYTPGVQEHSSWSQDGAGWTRCYLNREPDLPTVCRAFGGIEDTDGSFEFLDAETAVRAAKYLGVHINIDIRMNSRKAILKQHKDGRLVVRIKHEKEDRGDKMQGWAVKKTDWQRIFSTRLAQPEVADVANHDDVIRKLVTQTETREDAGWMINAEDVWGSEPKEHIKLALGSKGCTAKEITGIMGSAILRPWKVVNKPFQPEYPGDREWNRNAAQLRFPPTQDTDSLLYPTWTKILEHCGKGLDDAIKNHPWCKANGILNGADYLKIWVASLFQDPYLHLPYLFFYGPEDSGKSSFHRSLKILLTKGYVRGDSALTNQAGFNGELDGAIICVVEETDLRKNKMANRRMKDWVEAPDFNCAYKGKTAFLAINTMHWIQCQPADTWIQTSKGPKQIRDLINTDTTVIVHGQPHKTKGFFKTGEREVFKVTTKQGYSFEATAEHPVLVVDDGWVPVSRLQIGDNLRLNAHNDLNWDGHGSFDDGYILGWLMGDGSLRRRENRIDPVLYFYGEKDRGPLMKCSSILNKCNILKRNDGSFTLAGLQLLDLCREYSFNRTVPEDISSDFYCGFLSAFFDADGSCISDASHHRMTLYQSDKQTLQAVQRMLLRLGMTSSLSLVREAGNAQAPQGVVKSKASYALNITNRINLRIFSKRIGSLVHDLERLFDARRASRDVPFLAKITSVITVGVKNVYDIHVPSIHCYDGNGFVLHNCDNDFQACAVFSGDTRVTMCYVDAIDPLDMIPKKYLFPLLEKEAPDFLAEILSLEIPESNSRLNVPIVETKAKSAIQKLNQNSLEQFIDEMCTSTHGQMISVANFYNKFFNWLEPMDQDKWSKIKMNRALPPQFPKARRRKDGHHYIGNIWWQGQEPDTQEKRRLVINGDYLEPVDA